MDRIKVIDRGNGKLYDTMELHAAARHISHVLYGSRTHANVALIETRLKAGESIITTGFLYRLDTIPK